ASRPCTTSVCVRSPLRAPRSTVASAACSKATAMRNTPEDILRGVCRWGVSPQGRQRVPDLPEDLAGGILGAVRITGQDCVGKLVVVVQRDLLRGVRLETVGGAPHQHRTDRGDEGGEHLIVAVAQ